MIPDKEQRILDEAVDAALALADEGKVGTGYKLLSDGLQRAQTLMEQGRPESEELVLIWEEACQQYQTSFGLLLE